MVLFGLILTVFLPGFLIIEAFFAEFKFSLKLPLYIIVSVLVSTWIIFLAGHLFVLNRTNVVLALLTPLPLAAFVIGKKNKLLGNIFKEKFSIIIAVLVFIVFFVSLYCGIFVYHNGYYVLASVNWQDTAMHLGIIESIAEGNFPPQAPYMAGKPLTYYYFSDLHAAIINIIYGKFLPKVLAYVNPVLAAAFFMSVYSLASEFSKNKLYAIFSALLATLYSNWIFLNFLVDLSRFLSPLNLDAIRSLLASGYSIEPDLFQMAPMADYFLQNRPMMVGLPVVVLVLALLLAGFENNDKKHVLLAGVLTALVFKFQLFAFLICSLIFGIVLIFNLNLKKIKELVSTAISFLLPVIFALAYVLLNSVGDKSIHELVIDNFRLGSWMEDKNTFWYMEFFTFNLGIPAFIFLISPIVFIIKKSFTKNLQILYVFGFITLTLPFTVNFTIYRPDMFKFFYFSIIAISIMVLVFVQKVFEKYKQVAAGTFVLIVVVSTISSVLVLVTSTLNKNMAYTKSEYEAGLWMRENTPERAVFLTYPTVHTPTTQIAGRLRVLSYINWPHSHGFNTGEDNVFSRLSDIEKFYLDPFGQRNILAKYGVDYIYYGLEEKYKYPDAESRLNEIAEEVYSSKDINIYEVN